MGTTNAGDMSVSRRPYRPLIELGRGGMARVYLAESLASGIRKLVVLKILNRNLADDKDMRAAFRQEAELSARMNHPNVVQVYEVVEYGGTPVIVMEYLEGISLSRVLQHSQLPLRLHLYVLTQVLAGLHHFHELRDFEGNELNAVHRDVSPQNVLVLYEGPVKVLDFGIAKINSAATTHTRTGMIKGKIHYMPPEQLLGEDTIDRRADIFAVGIMLWEAIAGQRMWGASNEGKVIRALAKGELPRLRDVVPDVPEDLERITERAIAIDKTQRYATALEMQTELEQALVQREGYVQARELSEFMAANFGDRRQFQQHAIERALRSPATTVSGVMECVTPPAVEIESSSVRSDFPDDVRIDFQEDFGDELGSAFLQSSPGSAAGSGPRSTPRSAPGSAVGAIAEIPPFRPRPWKALVLAGVGLAVAVVAAGSWLSRSEEAANGAPTVAAASPASPVHLQVVAHPPEAEIRLDGAVLGTGRVDRDLTPSDQPSVLEVVLAGYVSERREILLRRDTVLEVNLRPEADQSAPAPARETREANAAAEAAKAPVVRKRVPPPPARPQKPAPAPAKPEPAPAPAPQKAANCDPPYKLSADGVKVFKPECF